MTAWKAEQPVVEIGEATPTLAKTPQLAPISDPHPTQNPSPVASNLEKRLKQAFPYRFKFTKLQIATLHQPVVLIFDRWASPVELYDTDPDFRVWIEERIEYLKAKRSEFKDRINGKDLLVNLVRMYWHDEFGWLDRKAHYENQRRVAVAQAKEQEDLWEQMRQESDRQTARRLLLANESPEEKIQREAQELLEKQEREANERAKWLELGIDLDAIDTSEGW